MDVTKQCFLRGSGLRRQAATWERSLRRSSLTPRALATVWSGIWWATASAPISMRTGGAQFAMKRKGLLLAAGHDPGSGAMINMGTYEVVWMDDDWTVVTKDHSLSAHYENTILITEGEPEILSL